ncbi:hypothetical protein ACWIGI_41375 [Nocardia sp. NPDC055321]
MKVAIVAVLATVALAGCASSTGTPTESAVAVRSSAAVVPGSGAPPAEPAQRSPLRMQTCEEMLAMFTAVREAPGAGEPWDVRQAADNILAEARTSPKWAGWSEEERADFTAGLREAAQGSCP